MKGVRWGGLMSMLNPLHPRADGDSVAAGFKKQSPAISKAWLGLPSSMVKLEQGLILLAEYLSGGADAEAGEPSIPARLNGLTALLLAAEPSPDFRDVAEFLFGSGRFRGNEHDYYAAENSNLGWVLRERQGNPILLACVMILVGQRAGIDIGGCNFPAHFLARHESREDGVLYLIDCFNGGKVLPAEVLVRHQLVPVREIEEVVRREAAPELILSRVLRNLAHAFERAGELEEQQLMRALWDLMAASGEAE